ncbi:hypothetical protein ACHAXR_009997 [Thalassiosira sp. AJA248-18]
MACALFLHGTGNTVHSKSIGGQSSLGNNFTLNVSGNGDDDVSTTTTNPYTNIKLNDGINFYTIESTSLLKRSMLHAGFQVEETIEINEAYLNFASMALAAEIERIEKIRDALSEKQAARDRDCFDIMAAATSAEEDKKEHVEKEPKEKEEDMFQVGEKVEGNYGMEGKAYPGVIVAVSDDRNSVVIQYDDDGSTETLSNDNIRPLDLKPNTDLQSGKYGKFLLPELKPGQAETLKWEDDGSIVQSYATRIGLPPQLVPTLTEYVKEMGLFDIMMNKIYDNPINPGEIEWYSFQSPYQKKGAKESDETPRNFTWNVERPSKKWFSDAHWFNTVDELSHEDALRALAKGGFDDVLKGIGELYDLDALHVDGIGFMAITNCDGGYIHTDFRNTNGGGFDVLFEIVSPGEDAGAELIVEGDNKVKGEIHYSKNVGWVNGDGTRHGTALCDHRAHRGVRITATVFMADVREDNLSVLAEDTSSIFPPMEHQSEWIWAQRGRHWRRGGGPGLQFDQGRAAFEVGGDVYENCTEEACNTEKGRNKCLKTCKVFMDDISDYKPDMERRELLGY